MWQLTCDPLDAPNQPQDFTIEFTKGIPSSLEYEEDGKKTTISKPIDLFLAVNSIAKKHGVGRIDIVRTCIRTFGLQNIGRTYTDSPIPTVGEPLYRPQVKGLCMCFLSFSFPLVGVTPRTQTYLTPKYSHAIRYSFNLSVRVLFADFTLIHQYETPGLTCLRSAHIDLEGLTLDREVRALRDQFVTISYGRVLYNGLYFSPEREYLHACLVASQDHVNGRVRCRK